MASIIDAFRDSLHEDFAGLKIVLYAIPVYLTANLYLQGQTGQFQFWAVVVGFVLLGLLTQGINNVRMNRKEILTLNPVSFVVALFKAMVVVVPKMLLYGFIGNLLVTKIHMPPEIPHLSLIYQIIVWSIIFSIIFTSYLSFAKHLYIQDGYNYKVIYDSCIDVLISLVLYLPQIIIANIVLIVPPAYLFFVFKLPFTHWGFVAICCMILIINISIIANYLAQSAYENIKGRDEDYNDNHEITIVDTSKWKK